MSYGEIIKSAFFISWRNRYLWFFGIFAGSGASVPAPNFGGGFDVDQSDRASAAIASADPWTPLAQAGPPDPGLVLAILLVGLLVILALIVLSLISQGALAESVAAIDRGGERRFKTAWRAGTRSFWRVLGLVALLIAIVLGVLIVVGVPLVAIVVGVFAATESLAARIIVAVVAGLVALAALLLIFIPLAVIGQLALRELVLREERPVAAVRGGYRLFRAQLGKTLLVLLIQIGIGLAAAFALLLAALLVGLALFLPTIGLAIAGQGTAALVTGIVAGVILFVLFLIAYGAVGTFNHAYWTLAYLRLRSLGGEASAEASA